MAAHGSLAHLLPPNYKSIISSWLHEDCPSFDYGGFVVGDSPGEARLLGKSAVPTLASKHVCLSTNKQARVW